MKSSDKEKTTQPKIFNKYNSWEKLSQHLEKIEGLTDLEKEKCKQGYRILKEELGNGFLEQAFNNKHPIINNIVNFVPWTRKWITWFAEAINELNNCENYDNLLKKLKDKNNYDEGLSIVEIAYKFSKAGYKMSFFPKVKVRKREKIPDIKLSNLNNDEIFIEVSIQKESGTGKKAMLTLERISHKFMISHDPFLEYSARIYKSLSEPHLNEIVKKIVSVVKKVKKENVFHELVINEIIEIGIAPKGNIKDLKKWANERKLKVGEFTGPPFNIDEIVRTKIKIQKEQKQLPISNANIVVVKNNNFFFHNRDIIRAIGELEEDVYGYPHLLAVVIYGINFGDMENVNISKNRHMFIKKTTAGILTEQYIIIYNRFCNYEKSHSTINKIYDVFKSY